ncbi:MAG TPA: 30S ribosomal protein S5 [Candidatus Peribacter riflensis]|uniref:Small ribosomal subunit protein uS5 n=1 Tax=Candidatus Peribacter riflensis TaxID=1735162 RepID=A0A0S1SKV2_9BACT|nr:MAG: 30S ribosomal subunit protein S5 [Candidatus Peribacter riflensis]OGJ78134.1 MAG: 30S ribosomal protein S5 [Candidatus Peribacteria bacterium RIFOXYB1_FULL_57_12]ALM10523.1 MAG: 30S ribosomal subunit protein S5 [Candidatus Peribacter riflensis]ALM11626.1 MAG: 30S ribosomal subunit protein S5 [Candidatus Peribacter riflensis]ALM12728.1 MAG: 30S ribosomal subunit protein S5 [Candidatus Peribacter riflensis]
MAKSSRPDRKKGDRRPRTPSEFDEVTLSVDRVTRVVAGGRRMRFRAIVVVGNKKGKVGLGTGKAAEVQAAVKKAVVAAKRHMIRIPLYEGSIPHAVNVKFKAAKIRLLPASKGTGIIAGGAVRVIMEQVGVQDVLSKRFGSSNKLVNAQAVMKALGKLKWKGGMPSEDAPEKKPLKETEGARQDAEALEGERLGITEVSKKDVIQ